MPKKYLLLLQPGKELETVLIILFLLLFILTMRWCLHS